MIVILAEKPSVAREIALILGAREKKEGYILRKEYAITWAFGHLISLAMPEDYGIKSFSKSSLPIIPDPFILTVRKKKTEKKYVLDDNAQKQLKIIEQLFLNCDRIIVATDAGREGELIFRYIYDYLKCNKPFQRFWISSLTEKSITKGFQNLKNGNEFDNLYQAAKSRSHADWLIGINATQALSTASEDGIYSIGRVQTPTLALICKRYLEYQHFEEKIYFQLQLLHTKDFIDFKSLSTTKWENEKEVKEIIQTLQRVGKVEVTEIEKKLVKEQAPLLFDLTGLQKEANKRLNLSAEETLNIAQSLYEKKFITYPRTGSSYIPEEMWNEIPHLIRILKDNDRFTKAISNLKWGFLNKRMVNDLGVTDHHGLLITEKIPSALSFKENAIYKLIAFRLLESVSAACLKEVTTLKLRILQHEFTSKNSQILEAGWRSIKGDFSEDSDILQDFPVLKKDEELKIKEFSILEKKTKPKALYTEASLLAAMETAGNEIENVEERKILQNIGIGTPATRAAIIEILLTRNYIERKNKALIPTEKGLNVFERVKDKKIANVQMTAEWELHLRQIELGKMDADTFLNQVKKYTLSITNELIQTPILNTKQPRLICPK